MALILYFLVTIAAKSLAAAPPLNPSTTSSLGFASRTYSNS